MALRLVIVLAARRGKRSRTKGIELMQPNQVTSTSLLVDPRTAAHMLAVSPRKLWAMSFEEQPSLPHIKCGRLTRYFIPDLERYIESRRQGGDVG
jgi:hypothetical protein